MRRVAGLVIAAALVIAVRANGAFAQANRAEHVVGVTSNLLAVDGRVIFAQADHTLTALRAHDGEILARRTDADYGGGSPPALRASSCSEDGYSPPSAASPSDSPGASRM